MNIVYNIFTAGVSLCFLFLLAEVVFDITRGR